jgi:glycerol-3-phosphate dehydrogenase
MNRESMKEKLRQNEGLKWDVIIAGGGATGLGIALDAALRGYNTILLERADFSSGTSSRSTKLVHGGVRYLAQGDILLVAEALRERGLLLKNARHLTSNQEFIIPVYSLRERLLYTAGLKFYDLLAGKLSLGRSYFIGQRRVLERVPHLKPDGLKGGVVYHDGQFDDSRLAFSIASSAAEEGAVVLNYFNVTDLMKDTGGKISGVLARDEESGVSYEIRGDLVINATGVFAGSLLEMDSPGAPKVIRPSQGVHIVLDGSFLGGTSAVMIPETDDGRVLFAIPWYGKVVAGTTDTPVDDADPEPVALEEELGFILRNAGRYFTRQPVREDILSIFAGLRPLAAGKGNTTSTREISRRHKLILSRSGLLTITGGKWTSYRRMAEETLDRAIKAGMLEKRRCMTSDFSFFNTDPILRSPRLKIYGEKASAIEYLTDERHYLGELLDPRLPYTKAEIVWICRNEMPCRLEDVLARRTRALFLDVRAALSVAPAVAELMASELGFDAPWQQEQLSRFRALAEGYL